MKVNASIVLGALTIAASSPTISAAPFSQDGPGNGNRTPRMGVSSPEPNEALSPRSRHTERFDGQSGANRRMNANKEKKEVKGNERRQLPNSGLGLNAGALSALEQQDSLALNGLGLSGLTSTANSALAQAEGLIPSSGLGSLTSGGGLGLGLLNGLTGDLPLVGPLLGQVENLAGLQGILGDPGSTGAGTVAGLSNTFNGVTKLADPQMLEEQLLEQASQSEELQNLVSGLPTHLQGLAANLPAQPLATVQGLASNLPTQPLATVQGLASNLPVQPLATVQGFTGSLPNLQSLSGALPSNLQSASATLSGNLPSLGSNLPNVIPANPGLGSEASVLPGSTAGLGSSLQGLSSILPVSLPATNIAPLANAALGQVGEDPSIANLANVANKALVGPIGTMGFSSVSGPSSSMASVMSNPSVMTGNLTASLTSTATKSAIDEAPVVTALPLSSTIPAIAQQAPISLPAGLNEAAAAKDSASQYWNAAAPVANPLSPQVSSSTAQASTSVLAGLNQTAAAQDSAAQYWNAAAPVLNQLPSQLSPLAAQLNGTPLSAPALPAAAAPTLLSSLGPLHQRRSESVDLDSDDDIHSEEKVMSAPSAIPSVVASPGDQIASEVQSLVSSIDAIAAAAPTATNPTGNPLTYLKPPLTAEPTQDNTVAGIDTGAAIVMSTPTLAVSDNPSSMTSVLMATSTISNTPASVSLFASSGLSAPPAMTPAPLAANVKRDLPLLAGVQSQAPKNPADSSDDLSAIDQSSLSQLRPLAPAVAPLLQQYVASYVPPASPTPSSPAGSFHSVMSSMSSEINPLDSLVSGINDTPPGPATTGLTAFQAGNADIRIVSANQQLAPSPYADWSQDTKYAAVNADKVVGASLATATPGNPKPPLPLQRFVRRRKEQHHKAAKSAEEPEDEEPLLSVLLTARDLKNADNQGFGEADPHAGQGTRSSGSGASPPSPPASWSQDTVYAKKLSDQHADSTVSESSESHSQTGPVVSGLLPRNQLDETAPESKRDAAKKTPVYLSDASVSVLTSSTTTGKNGRPTLARQSAYTGSDSEHTRHKHANKQQTATSSPVPTQAASSSPPEQDQTTTIDSSSSDETRMRFARFRRAGTQVVQPDLSHQPPAGEHGEPPVPITMVKMATTSTKSILSLLPTLKSSQAAQGKTTDKVNAKWAIMGSSKAKMTSTTQNADPTSVLAIKGKRSWNTGWSLKKWT